jgi:hypothetical protein
VKTHNHTEYQVITPTLMLLPPKKCIHKKLVKQHLCTGATRCHMDRPLACYTPPPPPQHFLSSCLAEIFIQMFVVLTFTSDKCFRLLYIGHRGFFRNTIYSDWRKSQALHCPQRLFCHLSTMAHWFKGHYKTSAACKKFSECPPSITIHSGYCHQRITGSVEWCHTIIRTLLILPETTLQEKFGKLPKHWTYHWSTLWRPGQDNG